MTKKEKKSNTPSNQVIPLEDIVKKEYRTYQIYTLMDRAIPYLRDGLKPVQRRILWTLWKNNTKGLMKVSSATGLVLTLHPHGPNSIESAIVNMAQDFTFSNNYPLIDKKGYFGERMEPYPAAGRYIECKLGKVAELLLFDDLNQVELIPNYDEKVTEPVTFLPKLPLMLLNGAEGIGTGFSSVIPSFNHKEIIDSMVQYVEKGKCKKLKPYVRHFTNKIETDKGRYLFPMSFENKEGKIYITELPKGYDAQRTYKFINKFMEKDYVKDYIDSTVNNDVSIELVFKRGKTPPLDEVEKKMKAATSLVPNYTLISERGVKIFKSPEEIISIFTEQRLKVVKRRYELLIIDYKEKLVQNKEIIRFIKEKHYQVATKQKNRGTFIDYLAKKKFKYREYLADMPIYRMTKEEVEKRQIRIKDDQKSLKECEKIAKSSRLIKKALVAELLDVKDKLSELMKKKEEASQKEAKKKSKSQKKKRR